MFKRLCLAAVLGLAGCLGWVAAASADWIGRASLDGFDIEPTFISAQNPPFAFDLAVGGRYVYWVPGPMTSGMAIGRANLDTGAVDHPFMPVPYAYGVAVDRRYIYWAHPPLDYWSNPAHQNRTYIGRANLDGSDANPDFITVPGGFAGPLAVDNGHIYWAFTDMIGRANLDGTGVEPGFIPDVGSVSVGGSTFSAGPGELAVDGGHIYWSWGYESGMLPIPVGGIARANLDGSGVNPQFISGPSLGVAVDSQHIYWSSEHAPAYSIGRANLDGTRIERDFITLNEATFGLTDDGEHLYWSAVRPPPGPRPEVVSLRIRPKFFTLTGRRVQGRCGPLTRTNRHNRACTRPIALHVTYRLSMRARVTVTVTRLTRGRLVRGRCLRLTRSNRDNRACTRVSPLPGSLTFAGPAGTHNFTFDGRIGRRQLGLGHYRLAAQPTTPAGPPTTTDFTIIR